MASTAPANWGIVELMEALANQKESPPAPAVDRRTHRAAGVAAGALIAVMFGLLVWSYLAGGIVSVLLTSSETAAGKVAALRDFFGRLGPAAPAAYVAFVVLEVVIAPLPGAMLYAPGGVIFGGFLGGLLSLTGNVIGAGLACQIMRTFLGLKAQRYFVESGLGQYEERISERGAWLVFLLRLNPLTSSDLVSYAAGLTHLPTWKLMLATLAGMAPLCFAQAYFADGVLASFPSLIYPLAVACVVYAALAIWRRDRVIGRPCSIGDWIGGSSDDTCGEVRCDGPYGASFSGTG
ncbi:MAG TPA: VTT domain-containing protein [Caulifigura sp.]|nr:VTT domain-containing protein [Caulifigura sp.]